MYQALYRKYRPRTFDEVIGQEHITRTLKTQVSTGHLSHAYLFIGSRGTGKTTCARILARAVNCEHPVDGNPCCECPSCRSILDSTATDLVEIDAASNNGVDDVRALREEAVYSPTTLKRRVYIIDEVHMLSKPAFNALLKILEEPPEHLLFILATTELQKVPATILSRCQRYSFNRIKTPEIADYITHIAAKENLTVTEEAAGILARQAEGGMRDAMSLLDQCSSSQLIDAEIVEAALGLSGTGKITALLDCIVERDSDRALSLFNDLWMSGKDAATVIRELNALVRDILITKVAKNSADTLRSGSYDPALLSDYSEALSTNEIISLMTTLQSCLSSLRDTVSPKISCELCLASACTGYTPAASPSGGSPELEERVAKLEKLIKNGAPSPAPRTYENRPRQGTEYPSSHMTPSVTLNTPAPAEESKTSPDPGIIPEIIGPVDDAWKNILDLALPDIPMDTRFIISDARTVRGELNGNLLSLHVLPGFNFNRVNRSEITGVVEKAASQYAGAPVRVKVLPAKEEKIEKHSLDELKQYDITKFHE